MDDKLFSQASIEAIRKFYDSYEPCQPLLKDYRRLAGQVGKVKNIFYGDSITAGWPLKEFFPNHSLLNRGIGGDNTSGLHIRLKDDVLVYSPERVFMMIGINGIQAPNEQMLAQIADIAKDMQDAGVSVFLSSVLPLRYPDAWDRFQYQDKIVALNAMIREWALRNDAGYLDYHTALKDETGQLAEEFARPDGTHVKFAAYVRMSEIVAPFLK